MKVSPLLPHVFRILALLLSASILNAQEALPLIAPEKAEAGWTFSNGAEFPGATGSLAVDPAARREGHDSLKLVGDFTKGGKYVLTGRKIDRVDIRKLSLWLRYPDADRLTLRIHDATNQTHQISLKLAPSPDWQRVVFPLEEFFARRGQADAVTSVTRYESWGGAKDGKWHGPATALYVLISNPSGNSVRTLWLNDLTIQPAAGTAKAPTAFKSDFGDKLPPGWNITAGVSIEAKAGPQGSSALLLDRPLAKIENPISATGPAFPVVAGQWSFSLKHRADLKSADSSYHALVTLECLDPAGQTLETATVADVFGQHDWQAVEKVTAIPKAAATARFRIGLDKTWGQFRVADLSASFLAPPKPIEDHVARVLFSTAQLGNLLFPTDPRIVNVTVEARQPLSENERTLSCTVRDYWGAEQARPINVALGAPQKKGNVLTYPASFDLQEVPLDIGRYYEIHASVSQDGQPFHTSTSFAILPEAENKRFKPAEVPFTSRNWDNRSTEYIRLSDRLGVRICGLWGSWSAKPPYAAEAPKIELCRELGMGWLTTTPCKFIEAGKRDYDEQALRQGVRNLIAQFGDVRPLIINLGNEPHGTGDRVQANVAAYRAVYEEVKKVDPAITVVATSVEPNEEYFQLGYGQWCDAFDFHVYETPDAVRKTIEQYRTLMQKYHCAKPIWSTELGLNSQGQTRHAVAVDLIKKFTAFFAAGGVNASWFGLLYPDPDGKSFGSSGDSHNVFDCRFNRYAPRLDAIAYYNAVNAIGIKKFVEEKTYPGGLHLCLFRDRENRALQVLWKDQGRQDIALPLPGVREVRIIHIDGTRRTLQPGASGITLTATEDPLLILYESPAQPLPPALDGPPATVETPTASVARDTPSTLAVAYHDLPESGVRLHAPPFWTIQKSTASEGDKTIAKFAYTPPGATAAREADFAILLTDSQGRQFGELTVRTPLKPQP